MERPLVIGMIWGVLTGEVETSLKISLFFELMWLDHIPAGTYIPPVLSAACVGGLMLNQLFGLAHAPKAAVPLLLCIPLALLGTRVEALLRRWNKRSYNKLLSWVRHRDPKHDMPARIMLRSLAMTLGAYWVFFFVCACALVPLTGYILSSYGWQLVDLPVSWPAMWLAASIGGLLSLRLNRAYAFTAISAFAVMIFVLVSN